MFASIWIIIRFTTLTMTSPATVYKMEFPDNPISDLPTDMIVVVRCVCMLISDWFLIDFLHRDAFYQRVRHVHVFLMCSVHQSSSLVNQLAIGRVDSWLPGNRIRLSSLTNGAKRGWFYDRVCRRIMAAFCWKIIVVGNSRPRPSAAVARLRFNIQFYCLQCYTCLLTARQVRFR